MTDTERLDWLSKSDYDLITDGFDRWGLSYHIEKALDDKWFDHPRDAIDYGIKKEEYNYYHGN